MVTPIDPATHKPAAVTIRIHITFSSAVFAVRCLMQFVALHISLSQFMLRSRDQLKRLGPDRNSVRRAKSTWLQDECGIDPTGAWEDETFMENIKITDWCAGDETATPRYNNAILADMYYSHHLKVVCPAVRGSKG